MDPRLIGVYRGVGGTVQSTRYYSMERIPRTDPTTGVRVMQLTSWPALSHTLYYHCPSFTPDNALIFLSYSGGGRWSTPDAWRVNMDGSDLWPVTRHDGLAGFVISPDGKTLYAQDGGDLLAFPVGKTLELPEPETVGHIDNVAIAGTILGSITADGKYFVSTALMENGKTSLVRYATDGSESIVLMELDAIAHLQIDPSGTDRMLFGAAMDGKDFGLWVCDRDGENRRLWGLQESTGHYTFFGKTGKLISTVNKPFGSIILAGEDGETELVAKGGHFWHAAGSWDGEWIVSDTNWPDIGLVLINAKTGLWAPLCNAESSEGHPQWTHPHPMFSPDGNHVVFNSDRTGIGQVYSVEIPDSLRQQLAG